MAPDIASSASNHHTTVTHRHFLSHSVSINLSAKP
jgi:hypothetical protein